MYNNLIYILEHPSYYGITTFISAILFALFLYHFILYFQVKNRVYLLYSLYTFLVFIYTYYRDDNFFLTEFTRRYVPYIIKFSDVIKWLYGTVYLYFALEFIELHRKFPQWTLYYKQLIKYSFAILAVIIPYSLIKDDYRMSETLYNFVFLPVIFISGLWMLILISRMRGQLKYYILTGSGVFMLVATYSHILTYTGHPFRVLFYFAIIFEVIFFALGLGVKQKIMLEEKSNMQAKIIEEYKEHIRLQEHIQYKMDREIEEKSVEIEKLYREKSEEEKKKWELDFQSRKLELRMRALQTQMNPHFLFNSLNAIKHFMISNQKEKAVYFLGKLSKLLRMILDNSRKKAISLREELSILMLYVEVENMRLQQNIEMKIQLSPGMDPDRYFLPPLVFQPVIENAIWHGLLSVKREKIITLDIYSRDNFLHFDVTDTGIGRQQAARRKEKKIHKNATLGIDLTRKRLQAFTGDKEGEVQIRFEDLFEKDQPAGTKVSIAIPLV